MIEHSLDTNACIAVINGTSPAVRTMIAEALADVGRLGALIGAIPPPARA